MSLTGASCTASSVSSSHFRCGRPSTCAKEPLSLQLAYGSEGGRGSDTAVSADVHAGLTAV
jgi:hypothetical protein